MTVELLSSEVGSNARAYDSRVLWGCLFEGGAVGPWSDWTNVRGRALDDVLEKLQGKEIPGKEYLEEYLRDQHRRNCRPNTLRSTLASLDLFLSFIRRSGKSHLEQITRDDLFAFIEHEQDRGMKPLTVHTRLGRIKAFIHFLAEKEVVRGDVLTRRLTVKVPDFLPRAMDPEDVRRLLSAIDSTRDRAMFVVLLRTGMRIGELLSLLVREVNLRERKIEIYEAEKTRVGRVVYLSEDARVSLRAWLKERDPNKQLLFYAHGRHSMCYQNARKLLEKYLAKAGLTHRGYTLHSLRHTFASELFNGGMRLECLQQLLGHSSIEMTRLEEVTHKKVLGYIDYYTGMRRGEILSLKWNQVNLVKRLVYLGKTKNDEPRTTYLNDEVIEVFRFHDLRRCCRTNLRKAGVDPSVSMRILGHKTIQAHEIYNAVDIDDIEDAYAKLAESLAIVRRSGNEAVAP